MEKIELEKYNFKRNLLFVWPTWVGKTYQAKKIFDSYKNEITHEKLQKFEISDAKFKQLIKSNQLVLRGHEEYNCSIEFYPLEMMLRVDVLLYDDLWVTDVTEAYLRDLTFILDERSKKWLINIFTTNLKKEDLNKKLNERIVSRILYNTDVVVFQGEDKRTNTTKYFTF